MLSFAEALTRILSKPVPLGAETLALTDAIGRTLAEDVIAKIPMPAFSYSAMDGYAVASTDCEGPSAFTFPVVGESRTGHPTPKLVPKTACRIFTGAELPEGSDSVLPQEETRLEAGAISWDERPMPFRHVRKLGEDLAAEAVALHRGQRLTAARLGLLAALDRAEIKVIKRPQVVVLCTGDELRPAGSEPRPNSIPESNGIALLALAAAVGANVRLAPIAGDDLGAAKAAVQAALAGTDLLVTVGGASVGDYDVVRDALLGVGASLDFWKVNLRPGKPLIFGSAGDTLILGLPGNPASAQVTFTLFGLPLLRALQGDSAPSPQFLSVPLGAPLRQKAGRTGFYRATITAGCVFPIANQASGAPTSMAYADALVMIPAESEGSAAGDLVSVLML